MIFLIYKNYMKSFLKKKIQRFFVSKNVMKFIHFFHYIAGGFKAKKLNLSFENKKKRFEIVQELITLKNFKSYLEIGTFKDELFNYIKCEKKVGVDPVSGGNIRETSDNYFKNTKDKFDLIFIDGLHVYAQVKKDINNSLNILNEGGIVMMHDCMPRDYYYQAVPRSQLNWNGDTWKAFLEIRSNENFDSYCCYADEGIGVILKRKNKNLLNLKIKNFKKIKFNDYVDNYIEYLNLIETNQLIDIIKKYE
mgnify:CR=1 FL=1